MMRTYLLAALTAVTCLSLCAQAPKGWKVRVDRSSEASDPDASGEVKLTQEGQSLHAFNPQAAVYWNPADTASGAYTLKGTFTLLRPSSHTNYYGLVFGGSALEGAQQKYLYFVVAQDGTWLLKRRDGNSTRDVKGYTPSPAVKRPDATGKSVNSLEVRVGAAKTDFAVNGTVVYSVPKSGDFRTDGIWGARVNHVLDVQIDGLSVVK
jgi:hypothetical protein